jgi:DNA-binding CsgD family transcriptional regulator
LSGWLTSSDRQEGLDVLTPREREVFLLASQGLRNAEIAAKLYLSEKTIKTHLRNIYGKLALGSKADLRVYAERLGVTPESGT